MPGPMPGSTGGGGIGTAIVGGWGKSGPPIGTPSYLGMMAGRGGGWGGMGAGLGGPMDIRKKRMQGAAPMPGGGYNYQDDPLAGVSGYKGPENLPRFRDAVEKGGGDFDMERFGQVGSAMKSLMAGRFGPGRMKTMNPGFGDVASSPLKKLLAARLGGGM